MAAGSGLFGPAVLQAMVLGTEALALLSATDHVKLSKVKRVSARVKLISYALLLPWPSVRVKNKALIIGGVWRGAQVTVHSLH